MTFCNIALSISLIIKCKSLCFFLCFEWSCSDAALCEEKIGTHVLINFCNFKALYRSTMIFVVMHLFFICHSLRFFLDIREFWKMIAPDHSALKSEKNVIWFFFSECSSSLQGACTACRGKKKLFLKSLLLLLVTDGMPEINWICGYLHPKSAEK